METPPIPLPELLLLGRWTAPTWEGRQREEASSSENYSFCIKEAATGWATLINLSLSSSQMGPGAALWISEKRAGLHKRNNPP